VLTAEVNTPAWLGFRKSGVGASEAAAVLGDSSWGTPYSVYLDKISDRVEDIQNDRMIWGHRMEPHIAEWAQEDWPEQGTVLPSEGLLQSIEYPFMLATLDRQIAFPDGTIGPFEIKNVDVHEKYRWLGEGGQLVAPKPYWVQAHVQMLVTGQDRAMIQPFFGGNDLPPGIVIERDEAFIQEYLIGRIGDFWNYNVIPRVPPEASLGDDLWSIWPGETGLKIVADEEAYELVAKWRICHSDRLANTRDEKQLALQIAKFMGDATELVDPFTEQTIHTLRPRVDGVRTHKATKEEVN
jgi:putative phage-type endonuclease